MMCMSVRRPRRSSHLVLLGMTLLAVVGQAHPLARLGMTLGTQVQAMSARGLTLAQGQERLEALNTLLKGAGYGPMRRSRLEDGTLLARWSHAHARSTVLMTMEQQETGDTFTVSEVAGQVRWNELIATP